MKKRKTALIIIITLIVLLVLASGACAALYFTTDVFKSNEERFWKYFSKNIDALTVMQNENLDLQTQLKKQNSYTTTGALKITSQSGTENMQQIDVATTSRHDANTGRTYADATLKKGDNNLITVSYINSNDVYAIKCDNIYQYYIGFRNNNLKELAKNMGTPDEQLSNVPDRISLSTTQALMGLLDEQGKQILNNYSDLILQTIPKENYKKYDKEQISLDGVEYNTNKYGLTLEGANVQTILLTCLTKLKEDNNTLNYINNKILELDTNYDINNTVPFIENLINEIENDMSFDDGIITFLVYEQNGKTLKTELEMTDFGKLTIDLLENKVSFTLEEYENLDENMINDGTQGQQNAKVQVVFSKIEQENEITNTISIVPNVNNPEQTVKISATLGNTQSATINNSYLISISNVSENVPTTQEISFNTATTTASQVEEIMELQNSNSVIINNYPIEQLQAFFNSLAPRMQQVLVSVVQALQ